MTVRPYHIFIVIVFMLSCSTETDNSRARSEIDKLPFSVCYVLLEVDSNGHVLDSIAIERFKRNRNNARIYYESESVDSLDAMTVKKYYGEDGTAFLEIGRNEDASFLQKHETFMGSDNRLSMSVSTFVFEGTTYRYEFVYQMSLDDDDVYSLYEVYPGTDSIKQELGIIRYNEMDRIEQELMFENGDMIRSKELFYSGDEKIFRTVVNSQSDSMRESTVVEYNSEGHIVHSHTQSRNGNELVSEARTVYKYAGATEWKESVMKDELKRKYARRIRVKTSCD